MPARQQVTLFSRTSQRVTNHFWEASNRSTPNSAVSPFTLFFDDHPELRDRAADPSDPLFGQHRAIVAQAWNQSTQAERQHYMRLAEDDFDRYMHEQQEYAREAGDDATSTARRDAPSIPLTPPERPPNAFVRFCNDRRDSLPVPAGGFQFGQRAGILAQMWKDCSDAERAVYEQAYAKDKEVYDPQLAAYEAATGRRGRMGPPVSHAE
jgi:hypothetical protein